MQEKDIPQKRLFKQRKVLSNGTRAPDFTIPRLGGNTVSLNDYQGKKRLVIFIQPGCPPCERLYKDLADLQDPKILIIMVSQGTIEQNEKKLKLPFGYPFLVGIQPKDLPVSRAYGAIGTPMGYLIDKKGIIIGTGSPLALLRPRLENPPRRRFLQSAAAIAATVSGLGLVSKTSAEVCQCPSGEYYDEWIHCCTHLGVTYKYPGHNPSGLLHLEACPLGQRVQNPWLYPYEKSGGCGPAWWPFPFPSSFPPFTGLVPIHECCGWQEGCYRECWASQEDCDAWVGPCIENMCRSYAPYYGWEEGGVMLEWCLSLARDYQRMSREHGGIDYYLSQATFCLCCDHQPCPPPEPNPPPGNDWRCPSGVSPCWGGEVERCGGESCVCIMSAEGTHICVDGSHNCAGSFQCQNSAQCPQGWFCAQSCCGQTCLPGC